MARKEQIRSATRKYRALKSEDEKGKTKENDKIRKATMRKNMTEEEKRIQREKDKRRKAENRKLKKELEKDKEGDDRSKEDEEERREEIDDSKDEEKENNGESYVEKLRRINRKSQMKKRSQRSNIEIEFDRIDALIRMREERKKEERREKASS